jgi:hypothetical protein
MTGTRRFLIIGATAALCVLGWAGVASASDHESHHGSRHGSDHECPYNTHSGHDNAMHPECPGDRDIRDDDPEGQDAKGLFDNGAFFHGERH